jgi:hypothetical protein
MAKYVLKSLTGYVGTDRVDELSEFTDEDFERYENGKMSSDELIDYQQQAIETQGFEWWIEKVKE